MKRIIIFLLTLCSVAVGIYAQTADASRMYKEIKADKHRLDEYIDKGFAGVDSTSVHDLAVLLYYDKDYKSAGACWEVALTKVTKYGKAYEQILEALTYVYLELDDNEKIEWLLQVVEDHNEHELKKEVNDYKSMLDRAQYYFNKGDEASAKKSVKESMDLCRNDEELAEVEEAYARMLFSIRDFEASALYYYSAAKRLKATGANPESVGENLYHSAQCNIVASLYETAEARSREAIECLANSNSEKGIATRIAGWAALGDAQFCQGKYEDALSSYQVELDSYSSMMPKTEKHADALEDMAKTEVRLEKYDPAIAHFQEALDIYKKLGLETKYSNTYSYLLICYRKSGNNELADAMEQEARNQRQNVWRNILASELKDLETTRKHLGLNVYTNSVHTIAGCYFGLEQYTEAADYFSLYVKSLRDMLMENFVVMDGPDRKRLWSEHQSNIEEFCYSVSTLPDISLLDYYVPTMYDMELLSKGILLNSSIEFEKVLNNSGRKDLLEIYEALKTNHKMIDELQKSSSEQDLELILNLKQENIILTDKLMSGCKEVRDFTEYLSYSWKDIQKNLSDGDVAIEFATLQASYSEKDTFLVALVLQPTGEPQMVIVSNKAILKGLANKEDLYDNPAYYKHIWGKLQSYIDGKNRIFFAPNNLMAAIAVEYIVDKDVPFFETQEVYRLSSTKELCKEKTALEPKTLVLFGDIDYNSSAKSEIRGGLSFGKLVYGAEEVDGINKIIHRKCKVTQYRGSNATEKQFLKVSDNCPDILHISSHGKYVGNENTKDEDAMQYSFLALSGANLASNNQTNDGIVTADDVSGMNLRSCDLVVLSACESGLGGLGTDGVFGLQRGFKNAGVHSILMSLKPVYDESTAKLMIEFYAGLTEGLSKREALVAAQKTLRTTPAYSSGKYWAPFILLDAFDK